jgi:hypothetical protein
MWRGGESKRQRLVSDSLKRAEEGAMKVPYINKI